MIRFFWRYSHLALAVSSFLLLTLASLTGIILAFEPIANKAQGYKVSGFDTLTLAHTIPVLKEKLHGLQEVKVDDNDFAIAKYTTKSGNDTTVYIHPQTAEVLGAPEKQSVFFEWTTSLHRSLFMDQTGRAFMGVTSFLLILIAVSGIALILQRQKSLWKFFAPIEKTSFSQYYHTVFGRLSLVFILAIAVTGTYLSVSRFFIKPQKISARVNESDIKESPEKALKEFAIFQQVRFSAADAIEFPFSDFPEDYYTLKLKDRELCVNQFTGDVLAQSVYPKAYTLANFSLRWHTGRANGVWAIILAITCGYILFFIYSGFVITWKRIGSKSRNKYKANESRIIILVGSENGSTYRFARTVFKQLLRHGEKVYMTDMDKYETYPKAEQLLIFTSTYGEGEPPSNAKYFLDKVKTVPQQQQLQFAVLGFGSRTYTHFCGYANEVDAALRKQCRAVPLLDIMYVNDRSPQDFSDWITAYTKQTGAQLLMPRELLTPGKGGMKKMVVTAKTDKDGEGAFLMQLKLKGGRKIASGDLLVIYPKNDHRERLYSIGMVNGKVQLSVKLHHHGLGSGFLYSLKSGEAIKAKIQKNLHFHFPRKATQVIMICNGTGIAPFLGMLDENKTCLPCTLYCGFRTRDAFALYQPFLGDQLDSKRLSGYHLALSREGEKNYVNHLLQRDAHFIWSAISGGAVIMLCGSLAMQKDVMATMEKICRQWGNTGMEAFKQDGKILTDCY